MRHKIELIYFKMRALAEAPRLLLHYTDIEYDYMLVLPDDLTSPDNEERIMIYGEIGFSSKTISRHGSFQNTFNFKEFICSKANALKCRFDGKMTSEFITKNLF